MKEVKKKGRKEVQEGKKEGTEGRKDLYGRALVAPCMREGKKEGRRGRNGGEGKVGRNCGRSAYYTFSLCYAAEATSVLPSVSSFLAWPQSVVPIFKFW